VLFPLFKPQELNDKKRLATSYANIARAYTVANGTCKFPENFTGCQDLAKKKVSSTIDTV
jgi:photosystem I subunit PsaN